MKKNTKLLEALKIISEAWFETNDECVKMIRDTLEEYLLTGKYRPRRGGYRK